MGVTVSGTAFLLLVVEGICRTVLQAATTTYAILLEDGVTVCDFDIIHGTNFCTGAAAGTFVINNQVFSYADAGGVFVTFEVAASH